MKIGLITKRDKAHKTGSVMQAAVSLLETRAVTVESIYPEDAAIDVSRITADCDLYLLKSGTEMALSLAGALHAAGARILNPYPSVVAMRDKIISTKMLQSAGVPLPVTWFAAKPEQLEELLLKYGPIVVKPFWAASQGRGVQVIRDASQLAGLSTDEGLFFAQRYHEPDGLDYKIYVIGGNIFGVRRVWPPKTLEDKLGEPFDVPADMRDMALRCGTAFGASLYGVDIITSSGEPFIVDINSFPGYKGVPGAAELLCEEITKQGEITKQTK
ncbi:MAG: hypothetical protein IPJ07_13380 [Acidobacteria bacterium]|nr:hypothetical protein [Acidobacteriota bacterium]